MPDMDGYETAALIRQRDRSRRIPIIFLTAYDKDDAQVFRGYSQGAVDYVFKPVEPAILRAKVSVFIDLFRQSEEIRLQAEQERRLLEENIRIRSARLEAEQQLRSAETREAMVFRQLPIAVYEVCHDGRDMAQNAGEGTDFRPGRRFLHGESAERLFGYDAEEFSRNSALWAERIHPEDREVVEEALAAPGGTYSIEYRWRCANDEYRYFLDQGGFAVDYGNGRPRIFGTMFDVHSRRVLEQQLLHAQKIDAIGKLTGGIAHDFNNMLTVVIGNLDRLQRTGGLDTRTTRRVDHALQGALHCRDITQRLLGFARQEGRAPRTLDLNDLIQSLSDLVARTLGERIEIRMKPQAGLWPVQSDADQIESALLNLLVNARDAMPDGGTVTIRTQNVSIAPGAGEATVDLPEGDFVVLEVADSGVGMPPEVQARAREAFFTTKGAGKGTGLGLSTICDFARRAGGDLGIVSAVGEGTRMRIYLPRLQRPDGTGRSERHEESGDGQPPAGSGEVILVVEDEEPVRRLTAGTLRELGYRVLEAANAGAALDVLDQAEGVSLLFTDIVMPGSANGYQLAQEATRRLPDLKVLFTSAYDGEAITGSTDFRPGPLLRKPYRDQELARAIRNAITES